jgi:2-amino-4-hydroxy-6-hydroxymethyldihydropteridine diphosphokinase
MTLANVSHAYVSLGSNLGDRAGYLLLAIRGMLEAQLEVSRLSAIYETEPVDNSEQPLFLNMVAELRCGNLFTAEQTMARLLRIEYALGRKRDGQKGPRTIDLDLLFFGCETRDTQFLHLPHPRLPDRRFVLEPLAELCPNLVHPASRKTVSELLLQTSDHTNVKRWGNRV